MWDEPYSPWNIKRDSDKILVLWNLIENSNTMTLKQRKEVWAVLQGIISYTDQGQNLKPHHRKYLREHWDRTWNSQKNDKIKQDIAQWLNELPF